MKVVDCRGMSCPVPVLKTKTALEEIGSGTVTVLVDSRASKENVVRFAKSKGCSVDVEEEGGAYRIRITTTGVAEEKGESNGKGYAVLITSTYVGEDKELGKVLLKGFIKTFLNLSSPPSKVVLINSAVKLACGEGDEDVKQALKELERKGVKVICCATCLDYYKLLDRLEVGAPSNAYEVLQALTGADFVLRL